MDAELRGALDEIRMELLSLRGEVTFARMEASAARVEATAARSVAEDARRHMDIVAEDLRGEIRQVAEGVLRANDRIERLAARVSLFE